MNNKLSVKLKRILTRGQKIITKSEPEIVKLIFEGVVIKKVWLPPKCIEYIMPQPTKGMDAYYAMVFERGIESVSGRKTNEFYFRYIE